MNGKCMVCSSKDIARAEISLHVTITTQEDLPYFDHMEAYACKRCGFIQLLSKVKP